LALIWIVGSEADDKVALGSHHQDIPPHRYLWERLVAHVDASVRVRSGDGLEVVPVEMERVLFGVVTVQDDLDHIALFQDEGVGVLAIDGGV